MMPLFNRSFSLTGWTRVLLIGLCMAGMAGLPSRTVPAQDSLVETLDGKGLYEVHCLRCHGTEGRGDGPQARALSDSPANFQSPTVKMKSDAQWLTTIDFGRGGTPMHSLYGRLTEQEMRAVVAYVRKLSETGR